jgi:hypothetical protein
LPQIQSPAANLGLPPTIGLLINQRKHLLDVFIFRFALCLQLGPGSGSIEHLKRRSSIEPLCWFAIPDHIALPFLSVIIVFGVAAVIKGFSVPIKGDAVKEGTNALCASLERPHDEKTRGRFSDDR